MFILTASYCASISIHIALKATYIQLKTILRSSVMADGLREDQEVWPWERTVLDKGVCVGRRCWFQENAHAVGRHVHSPSCALSLEQRTQLRHSRNSSVSVTAICSQCLSVHCFLPLHCEIEDQIAAPFFISTLLNPSTTTVYNYDRDRFICKYWSHNSLIWNPTYRCLCYGTSGISSLLEYWLMCLHLHTLSPSSPQTTFSHLLLQYLRNTGLYRWRSVQMRCISWGDKFLMAFELVLKNPKGHRKGWGGKSVSLLGWDLRPESG